MAGMGLRNGDAGHAGLPFFNDLQDVKARTAADRPGQSAGRQALGGLNKKRRVAVRFAQSHLAAAAAGGRVGKLIGQRNEVAACAGPLHDLLGFGLQHGDLFGCGLFGNRHQDLGQIEGQR